MITLGKNTGIELDSEEIVKNHIATPEIVKPKLEIEVSKQQPKSDNLPGVIVTSKPKSFKEDVSNQMIPPA